jgi:hypothetical protein
MDHETARRLAVDRGLELVARDHLGDFEAAGRLVGSLIAALPRHLAFSDEPLHVFEFPPATDD